MTGMPVGLDFGSVMQFAAAQDCDLELLSETLPDFEAIILAALSGEPMGTSEEEFS